MLRIRFGHGRLAKNPTGDRASTPPTTVVRFTPRRPPPIDRDETLLMRVELVKGTRRRLYQILRAGVDDGLQIWVRFNGKPHRAQIVRGRILITEIRAQFDREIAEHLLDGWTRTP